MSAARAEPDPLRIGLLAPQSGPIGLLGPSSIACARLAARQVNAAGGILGRQVELVIGDSGGSAAQTVACTEAMIAAGVEAVIGSHVSPNRIALVKAIGGRLPYVYATLYEGGEHAFGVFVCGETPEQQLRPLLHWLARNKGARRWYLAGNDYVFPRTSMALARRYLAEAGAEVVGEEYLPLHAEDFRPSLERLAASGADAVLIYLVGTAGILFNRQFAARGLDETFLRAAPVCCENMLLGIGAEGTRNLYTATGFTNAGGDSAARSFRAGYAEAFGRSAPVPNRFGIACHEGLHLLAGLAARAGSLNLYRLQLAAEGATLDGPRGRCTLRGNHLGAPVRIGAADGTALRQIDDLGFRAAAPPRHAIWPKEAGSA